MTTYSFSTLISNANITFDPLNDILLFDTNIRPAELLINSTTSGVQFSVNGKSIVLSNVTLDDLGTRVGTAIKNVQFVSTGVLVVGEGTTAHDGDLANLITGLAGDDALVGLGGNDTLDGGAGADLLVGGLGNDLYKVDNVGDVVTEENNSVSGAGDDSVQATVSYTLANYVENLALQGNGAINATGNVLANTLLGNGNANTLDGKAGADVMVGGDGNDIYFVDNVLDKVLETNSSATQIDTVTSTLSYALGANIENLTLIGATIVGLGNFRSNQMVGSGSANTLNGGYGADTMVGGDGNDTYFVENVDDAVVESSNSLTQIDMVASSISFMLGANLENLRLLGSGNIDATGNSLGNVLYANAGNNVLDGQGGTDTASYAAVLLQTLNTTNLAATTLTSSVTTSGVTVDLNLTGYQDTQGSGFDKLIGIENLTGSNFNDELTGNAGANVLDGGGGADVLTGGKGNDTYVVDGADVVVELNAGIDGLDTVQSSISYRLTANVEYLVLTATAFSGIGNNLDNRITGNSAANFLDGRAGADKMDGGAGNDTFVIDNLGDEITDTSGTADLVMTYINHTLGSTIENLRLMGTNALNATGNGMNNIIWANTGDNLINGGADVLLQGVRGDTLSYEYGATSGITLDLAITGAQATGGSGTDTVINVENLIGSNYNDLLGGTAGDNVLDGLGGVDTVSYIAALTDVTIDLTLGVALTVGNSDTIRNFENIVGGAFDDLMTGDLGNNVFDGGSAGSDTVSFRNVKLNEGGVEANLGTAGPQNTLASGFDTFIKIDNLEGSVNDDRLTGNGGANRLDGSAGQDTLLGQGGEDSLTGGLGDDSIDGGAGTDWALFLGAVGATVDLTLTNAQNTGYGADKLVGIENLGGGDGADRLTGNTGANSLSGGFGVDTLDGGAGDDELTGGAGADRLTGGAGLDVFVFESEFAADNVDRIVDFTAADDIFHLEGAIFNTMLDGALKAADFQANGTGVAKDGTDRILYNTNTGNLYYDADGTGSATAIQFAVIAPGLTLTAADFFVI